MKISIITVFALSLVACSLAQQGALLGAYDAIENNDCSSAYGELSEVEFLVEPSYQLAAEIIYLRGVCLEKEGKDQEAIGQFLFLIDNYPDSEYAYRAKSKFSMLDEELEEILRKAGNNEK